MAANSAREELGQAYTLMVAAAEATFLIQAIGVTPVRVVAVAGGGSVPTASFDGYFVIESARGASDSLARPGLEGADIYMRSDSVDKPAFVTRIPS